MNPLLERSTLPLEAIDFTKIKEEHFIPALEKTIEMANANLDKIKEVKTQNFQSVIIPMETASDELDQVVEIFYALYSAQCTDALSSIAQEFNEKLTNFSSDINLDKGLFAQVKAVYDIKDTLDLNNEEMTVLENTYKGFTRNGALLTEEKKNELRKLDQDLATLSLNFSENSRNATNDYFMVISDKNDLTGLPSAAIEAAAETAKEKNEEGKWVFTLDYPSYLPFMQYCQNRDLRQELSKAQSTKCVGGKFDNKENILKTLKAKNHRASLLGYSDYPSFVLEKRMAKESTKVLSFLKDIFVKAEPKAKDDFQKLANLKKELTGESDLRKFDSAFYTEILKKRELDIDDELLRPYFKLENVVNGVFDIAARLYDITFKLRDDLPKYHEDVNIYEVSEKDGSYIGLFYTDFHPRKEKRQGAWMTTFRNQGLQFGEVKRPFVSIVCNFTKPTASKPSLLTLNEVLTLFHEFGHGLHGLLAKSTYKSVAGTNVFWDFVELPSQIMENWVMEKECLDLFAKHFETGESIPVEYIEKIKKQQQFLEGLGTLRQLSLGYLDMGWHSTDPETITDVEAFEADIMSKYDLYPKEEGANMSCAFGHIFAGGYAAGYYSYKWAEVLDADAFAYFKEKGIFNKEVAQSFKENILEMGGTEDPMELYKRFRGEEPSIDPLLTRAGLI